MKIAAKIHIFFDIYKKSAILLHFLVIHCGSFVYLQKMLYLCKNFQTDMTATPNKKQPKTSKLSAWRKQIEESMERTRTRTQARYDAFHRRQEAYSRISDEHVQEPPKRITWLTAIRILLAELGEAEYWRTLWHLLWRPGYIINDYLNGYRRNYLRPFELLIATTIMLSIVIMIVPAELPKQESLEKLYQEHVVDDDDKELLIQDEAAAIQVKRVIHFLDDIRLWQEKYPALSLLAQSIFVIFFTWLLFRKSPRKNSPFVPDDTSGKVANYNFPEILTAQIFILSQLQFVNTLWVLVTGWFVPTLNFQPFAFPNYLTLVIVFMDYQQLFGRKWYSTLWRTLLCVIW